MHIEEKTMKENENNLKDCFVIYFHINRSKKTPPGAETPDGKIKY